MQRGSTFTYTDSLVAESCYKCGVWFGLSNEHHAELRDTGASFYCPNGHSQHYADSLKDRLARANAKLEQERAHARNMRDQRDATERRLNATKGVVTKQRNTLKRVAAGLCPCCNRSFSDLARHMQTKHPHYDPQAAEGTESF